jgi:hypothetical protein
VNGPGHRQRAGELLVALVPTRVGPAHASFGPPRSMTESARSPARAVARPRDVRLGMSAGTRLMMTLCKEYAGGFRLANCPC